MAYCGISEKYQCDKNPDSHEKKNNNKKVTKVRSKTRKTEIS